MSDYICGVCMEAAVPTPHACQTPRCVCVGLHIIGGGPLDGFEREHGKWAWTAVVTGAGCSIGVADQDVAGYSPLRETLLFPTWDEAQAEADRRNERMGLTRHEAELIVISSMRAQNRAGRGL